MGDPRLSSEAWVRLGFLGVCFRTTTNGLTLSKCLEITSEPVCGSCLCTHERVCPPCQCWEHGSAPAVGGNVAGDLADIGKCSYSAVGDAGA